MNLLQCEAAVFHFSLQILHSKNYRPETAMNRNTYRQIRLLRAPSSLTLQASQDADTTTSLGNQF